MAKLVSHVAPSVASPSRLENYNQYIQIIGIVEIIFGIFALLIGFVLILVIPLLNYALQFDTENSVPPELIPFFSALFVGIAVICFVYALVSIISGKKLLQYDNSGRIGTMVIAALNLLNVPFGTIFGLAVLFILSRPEVEQLYTKY